MWFVSEVFESVMSLGSSSEESTEESTSGSLPSAMEDFSDLDELQFLRLEGVDKQKRRIVRIVGKFLPATIVESERLKQYVTSKLTNEIQEEEFCIVYFNSAVDRGENSPGLLTLRRIYEDLPQEVRQKLSAVFFVHPGLRSRLVLATVGWYFLSEGFYSKLNYISRVEFLWDRMRKDQIEVPELVQEHDQELEIRPLMDYGLEANPFAYMDGPAGWPSRFTARTFG